MLSKKILVMTQFLFREKESNNYMKKMFSDWQAKGITSVLHEKKVDMQIIHQQYMH